MIPCRFCTLAGNDVPATKLMPQDERLRDRHVNVDRYATRWLPCCDGHAANWYGGVLRNAPPWFAIADGRLPHIRPTEEAHA